MSNPVLDGGFGFMLIVVFVSTVMSGVVISQACTYYMNYPKDRLWLKAYVTLVLSLDVGSTILNIVWQFQILVAFWGDADFFEATGIYFSLNPLFCGMTGLAVQLFLAWRLFMITRSAWLTGSIVVLAVSAAGGAVAVFASAFVPRSASDLERLPFAGPMWLTSTATVDIAITCILTFNLQKWRTGFEETNHILETLIRVTIQNGFLTSMTALTDLCLLLVLGSPTHSVSFLMPKLYANIVLASLNARRIDREEEALLLAAGPHVAYGWDARYEKQM